MKKEDMIGKIIIPAGVNVWPHEIETAKVLANHGYVVEFRKKKEGYSKSAVYYHYSRNNFY